MTSKFKSFKQTALSMDLTTLPRTLYKKSVRMDGQFTTKGMNKIGFESPGATNNSDLSRQERMSRLGHYQLDHGVILFCNDKGKIYGVPTAKSNDETLETLKLFREHGYKNAKNQDPWYSGSLHTAHVNSMLDEKVGNALFKPALI